jgi:hypothetical protein
LSPDGENVMEAGEGEGQYHWLLIHRGKVLVQKNRPFDPVSRKAQEDPEDPVKVADR